ncbi:epoxide hydrolase [Panus rudis PR-1116 ss-1]|nr:epoxide hydrolase [Panus rudis PR-1116 ss-1]
MQDEAYKDTVTSRGFKYHYYVTSATNSRPTLIFCHGFPSTSKLWKRIVPYFEQRGYGIIVPDMLGYGGTVKPTDPTLYKPSYLARDLVDILDAEGIQKAIAIGHDWGCITLSRLATAFPERFYAYAFFAFGYQPPAATRDYRALLAESKKAVGYELFGYWDFLSSDEAPKLVEEHWIRAGFGVLFPRDPITWKTHFAPLGAFKAALLSGEEFPPPAYLNEEDQKEISEPLLQGGFTEPCCYYKNAASKDVDDISSSNGRVTPPSSSPIFFGAASLDYICLLSFSLQTFASDEFKHHDVTVKEYNADHWLVLSHPDAIQQDLGGWIKHVEELIAKEL